MNFRKGQGQEDPEINLIPFIDVLLVILIFLMVTTTYSKYTELQITLPTADADKAMEKPFELVIAIDAKGNYALNGRAVSFHDVDGLALDLKSVVQAANQKDPVVILNADQFATHQSVINAMQAARVAGYGKITFTAQASGKR
ncbi:biopolymer transporter ExbD [Massilia sp. W12]|uniref:ExbD/TolR family protein n=1 Tax=Massilia sp. W12 TaxID=3126507 RepID=UPI0030D46816